MPSFEDLYQFEIINDSEDADQMALDAAKTYVKNSSVIKALSVDVKDVAASMRFEAANNINKQVFGCRYKPSGKIVSGVCSTDFDFSLSDCEDIVLPEILHEFESFLTAMKAIDKRVISSKFNGSIAMTDFAFVSDEHLGSGLGKKQVAIFLHELTRCGYRAFYSQLISDKIHSICSEVLVEDSILYERTQKYSDYVASNGTRPFLSVPGECQGVLWKCQLKDKYKAWSSSQKLVRQPIRSYSTAVRLTSAYAVARRLL